MLTAAGQFTVLDSAALPAGSTMKLAGIADFQDFAKWGASEYGAILYSKPLQLPGLLFVSSAGAKGPATLSPLGVAAASIAVEY
jgi:hypothetical protein